MCFKRFPEHAARPNHGVFGYDKLCLPDDFLEVRQVLCKLEFVCVDRDNVVKAAPFHKRIYLGHGVLHIQAVNWISEQPSS